MNIETKIKCPECGTIIDVKDIKRAIVQQITDFISNTNHSQQKQVKQVLCDVATTELKASPDNADTLKSENKK